MTSLIVFDLIDCLRYLLFTRAILLDILRSAMKTQLAVASKFIEGHLNIRE